jgi:hypothetical protein
MRWTNHGVVRCFGSSRCRWVCFAFPAQLAPDVGTLRHCESFSFFTFALLRCIQSERAAALIIADNGGTVTPPDSTGKVIHPKSFSGKCLDIKDGTLADGTQVQLWDCNGKAQQQFVISTGSTKVKVQGTNFCLDIGTATSGTKLKIWTVSFQSVRS